MQTDRSKLMGFVNSVLGEEFEDLIQIANPESLFNRREGFKAQVPRGVLFLTAGVDSQEDRIESKVVGWGRFEESWVIDYRVFPGFTTQQQVWDDLDEFLLSTFKHEDDIEIEIEHVGLDTGHNTQECYDFVRERYMRKQARVFALKGAKGDMQDLTNNGKRIEGQKVVLFLVDTRMAKKRIYQRLKIKKPGPGYIHFPRTKWCNQNFFDQLTAEKIKTEIVRGFEREIFHKVRRNEVLDCTVYAMGARHWVNSDWDLWEESIQEQIEEQKKEEEINKNEPEEEEHESFVTGKPRSGKGWTFG